MKRKATETCFVCKRANSSMGGKPRSMGEIISTMNKVKGPPLSAYYSRIRCFLCSASSARGSMETFIFREWEKKMNNLTFGVEGFYERKNKQFRQCLYSNIRFFCYMPQRNGGTPKCGHPEIRTSYWHHCLIGTLCFVRNTSPGHLSLIRTPFLGPKRAHIWGFHRTSSSSTLYVEKVVLQKRI